MPQLTDRELRLSKLLDEVLCLYAFAIDPSFAHLGGIAQQACREIATTRHLADKEGIEYPVTGALWEYLKKEGLL